jgi:hypothetical protein
MNHVPTCTCIQGYIGDPFTSCRLKPIRKCMHLLLIKTNLKLLIFLI